MLMHVLVTIYLSNTWHILLNVQKRKNIFNLTSFILLINFEENIIQRLLSIQLSNLHLLNNYCYLLILF